MKTILLLVSIFCGGQLFAQSNLVTKKDTVFDNYVLTYSFPQAMYCDWFQGSIYFGTERDEEGIIPEWFVSIDDSVGYATSFNYLKNGGKAKSIENDNINLHRNEGKTVITYYQRLKTNYGYADRFKYKIKDTDEYLAEMIIVLFDKYVFEFNNNGYNNELEFDQFFNSISIKKVD